MISLYIGETLYISPINAGDSKSPAERLVGSSPTSGTTKGDFSQETLYLGEYHAEQ